MQYEKMYAYKYGELTAAARSLANSVKEEIRLSADGPHSFEKTWMFTQANALLELLEDQRKRGTE